MVYIIPIVCIIVRAFLFWLGSKLFDQDCVFRSVIVTIFAVIFAIAVLVSSVNAAIYVDYKANEETRAEWRIEERNVLTAMLGGN